MSIRQFATEAVQTLRAAGYEALWAGGCVRDQILGLTPKDYDVATNATPDEVRQIFKSAGRATFAIGEAFGVIMVRGPRGSGNIEVATFRRDAGYSDGRRPDRVEFSTAEQDAERRDFTINGLFYDPIAGQVIDYVGGQADLERRIIRAIGDPQERFREDKLRMLRAVRFAATLDFEIAPTTLEAIQSSASDIQIVSAERIGMELRRMLNDKRRAHAVRLLQRSQLSNCLLPEADSLFSDTKLFTTVLQSLEKLQTSEQTSAEAMFPLALAAILREAHLAGTCLAAVSPRLKMTNLEKRTFEWVLSHLVHFENAVQLPWPMIQRLLIQDDAPATVELARATSQVSGEHREDIEFCRAKLRLPRQELNPEPLLTGHDLKKRGIAAGKIFKTILDRVRDAQLMGELNAKEDAWRVVDQVVAEQGD